MKKSLMVFLITLGVIVQLFIIGLVVYGVVDIANDIISYQDTEDEIVISIGEYISDEYYEHVHVPREMVSYEKYKYEEVTFNNNEYFRKITDETYKELENFIKDFEEETSSSCSCDDDELLLNNYTFNMDMVSENDYLYIEYEQLFSDNDYSYTYYHLYFFDTETKVLHEFYRDL